MRSAKEIFNDELSGEPLSEDVIIKAIEIAQIEALKGIGYENKILQDKINQAAIDYSNLCDSKNDDFEISFLRGASFVKEELGNEAIKFGRELLKNARPIVDGGLITWGYFHSEDYHSLSLYDTAELFELLRDKL